MKKSNDNYPVTLAQKMRGELSYVAVLNYTDASVDIFRVPAAWDAEAIEAFLFGDDEEIGQQGFNHDEVDWMVSKTLDVRMR